MSRRADVPLRAIPFRPNLGQSIRFPSPRGNNNAKKHARYSAKSRELRALGRLQVRTGDLLQAQLAAMESHARGDQRRVEIAEQHVSRLPPIAIAVSRLSAVLTRSPRPSLA